MCSLRTPLTRFAALLIIALSASFPAVAGVIVLVGDSQVANAVDPSVADALNQRFFRNVLGTGTRVLVHASNGAGIDIVDRADTAANTYYNTLSGVTSALFSGSITVADLAGIDLFVSIVPDDAYTASEVTALRDFVNGAGVLFLLGENNLSVFDVANAALNALVTGVGGTMSLLDDIVGGDAFRVAQDPLTDGVPVLDYAGGSPVSGGLVLFTEEPPSLKPLIAIETVGSTAVPVSVPGTLALLGLGFAGLAGFRRVLVRH
jgi:hypothetical protein